MSASPRAVLPIGVIHARLRIRVSIKKGIGTRVRGESPAHDILSWYIIS